MFININIKISYTSGIFVTTYQVNFIKVKAYGYTFRLMPAIFYPLQTLCTNVLYIYIYIYIYNPLKESIYFTVLKKKMFSDLYHSFKIFLEFQRIVVKI